MNVDENKRGHSKKNGSSGGIGSYVFDMGIDDRVRDIGWLRNVFIEGECR